MGVIKKTLAWQRIPCIPCNGKIEKYLQIKPFLAVAICNLVCCNQSSFSGLVTIFPIILRHKKLLVIVVYLQWHHFLRQSTYFFTFCYLELNSIAGFTATFIRMIIPKSSTCVQNMVFVTACKPSGWDTRIFTENLTIFGCGSLLPCLLQTDVPS